MSEASERTRAASRRENPGPVPDSATAPPGECDPRQAGGVLRRVGRLPDRLGWWLATRPGRGWLVVCGAALLAPPAVGIWQRGLSVPWTVVAYATLVAFAGAFAYVVIAAARWRQDDVVPPRRWRTQAFFGLCLLGAGVVVASGETGVVMWFALSQASLILMPRSEAWASIASIVVFVVLVPWTLGLDWEVSVWFVVAILGSAWATDSIFRMRATNRALLRAQQEIESMAVERERMRFSRDLHDIVGHSLTTATVKAQLAGRLIGADDARARVEIGDVEGLLREALGDVRATVAGYRDVTLSAEIVRAATVLDAAGIGHELPTAVDGVPGPRRELFGWVVREAVTNVVRHSSAGRCRVVADGERIEVWNDGVLGTETGPAGSGLLGLRERVEAAGGTLSSGPDGHGGWQVEARMDR